MMRNERATTDPMATNTTVIFMMQLKRYLFQFFSFPSQVTKINQPKSTTKNNHQNQSKSTNKKQQKNNINIT
jgi:hypothetical protein